MLKRVVPKRAVLRRARAGPGRAARLATYTRARTMLDCYTHGPSSPTVPLPSEEGNRLGFRANTFK